MHHKVSPRHVGISLVKNHEKDEEECPFPSFKQFNVETRDRCHSFSVPCDRVIKYIKLGAINKQIAIQYCHYLAELTRTAQTPDDVSYYESKCSDLALFILRNSRDIPILAITKLLCDVADTTEKNCLEACSHILGNLMLEKSKMQRGEFAQLLGSAYKFCQWKLADTIVDQARPTMLSFRIVEGLVQGIINASKQYQQMDGRVAEQDAFRSRLFASLGKFCRHCTLNRVQFITKQKTEFIQALKDLNLKIAINPAMKMSGRCTGCDTHIPLFDSRLVATINTAIGSQIRKGAELGLYLNTSPNDVNRFESYLKGLYEKDRKPIDCVIDGLNIAYLASTGYNVHQKTLNPEVTKTYKVPKPESQAKVLINCIIRGDLLRRFRKILVVGKWHMTKWPGLMDFFERQHVHFYSSFNNSKDDLFQIYAATLNPKTVLVTNDFLRDHLAQLEEQTRTLMERWIDTHQAWICQKSLKPIWPTPFEKIPHSDDEGTVIHLPVIDFHQLDTVGVYEPPPHLSSKVLTWVCCDSRTRVESEDKT